MDQLNVYHFDDFEVQSYLDEQTTRMLYAYVQRKGILGRTVPPRRGFIGMDRKLLWEKKFSYKGKRFILQGGGKRIAIFESIPVKTQIEAKQDYRRCSICGMRHPDSDLVETEDGVLCAPCYDALFPTCAGCGQRLHLPEGTEPDDGPFYCEDCRTKRNY